MAEFFQGGTIITHSNVIKVYTNKVNYSAGIIKDLNEIQKQLEIGQLYSKYLSELEEIKRLELAIDALEKYEINFEEEEFIVDFQQLEDKESQLKSELAKVNRVIKKLNKMIPLVYELEKKEIVYIYKNFIHNIAEYEDAFFEVLFDKYDILNKSIKPKELKKYYDEYKRQK